MYICMIFFGALSLHNCHLAATDLYYVRATYVGIVNRGVVGHTREEDPKGVNIKINVD